MANSEQHSGLRTAAELARKEKALANIARALAVTGLKGAAAATVKESIPFIIKAVLGVIIFILVLSMVVFTELPNIFFGFDNSYSADVDDMTVKASSIGSAYMDLKAAINSQMNSIITRLVGEYEKDGVLIDEIKVIGNFTADDLCLLIAINSVAKEQNLDLMNAEDINALSISRISVKSSLLSGDTTTLTVNFSALNPVELMEQMGFNEEQKNWAESLFHTLSDSGALEKYNSRFKAEDMYKKSQGESKQY